MWIRNPADGKNGERCGFRRLRMKQIGHQPDYGIEGIVLRNRGNFLAS